MDIKELRSVRVGPFAVFDVVGTIGLGYGVHKYTGYDLYLSIASMFVAGQVTHMALGIETPLNPVESNEDKG